MDIVGKTARFREADSRYFADDISTFPNYSVVGTVKRCPNRFYAKNATIYTKLLRFRYFMPPAKALTVPILGYNADGRGEGSHAI